MIWIFPHPIFVHPIAALPKTLPYRGCIVELQTGVRNTKVLGEVIGTGVLHGDVQISIGERMMTVSQFDPFVKFRHQDHFYNISPKLA